jgi:hypothetical protein
MKYCYNCGNALQDEAEFCGKCGKSTVAETNASAAGKQFNANTQVSLDSSRPSEKRSVLPWMLVLGLTMIMLTTAVCFFVFSDSRKTVANNPHVGNAVTSNSITAPKSVETATSGQQISKANTVSLAVINDFRVYVQAKERLNTEIIELASQINNRIAQTGGLRSSHDLRNRAQQLIREIEQYSGQLSGRAYPPEIQFAKSLLLQLFDLEMTRTRSLYNGIVEGSNGQDYGSSFSVGTSAAYKFDDVNSRFVEANITLDSLVSR